MFDNNNNNNDSIGEESIPEFFKTFDNALKKGINPGYFDVDELSEIAEIYFSEGKMNEGKYTVNYALKIYPDNEDLIYELLLLLNDFELWNDLLALCEKYHSLKYVWIDGHKLTALLHLGMEEDAFYHFRKSKTKYAGNKEDLSIIYQAMAEALYEIDLYEASIEVIDEIISIIGEDTDLLWLKLQSFSAIEDKENVIEIGLKIQNRNPMDADTWSRLGDTYKDIGELDRAIDAYEFAQSLGLKDSNNLMNLIYAYEKNENYSKALQKAEEFLSEYPGSYLVNLLAINICTQMENWEKGLIFVENAIKLEPQSESLYLYKCRFYLNLGEYKKAIKVLQEGIGKTKDTLGELKEQLDKLRKEYPE